MKGNVALLVELAIGPTMNDPAKLKTALKNSGVSKGLGKGDWPMESRR